MSRPLVAMVWVGACLAGVVAVGCGVIGPRTIESVPWGAYEPDRRDYGAFREAHPSLLEPNYLPFMVHRIPLDDAAGDALVFCRWDGARQPLRVHIEPPRIPDSLQDEFDPKPAHHYVTAVRAAFETWERNLEGLVRFRYVDTALRADIRVALRGEVGPAPESDLMVLGATPLRGVCRFRAWDPDADRVLVDYAASEFRVFVADASGLLIPDQVERVTLHEIGHVLGMSGHSPVPGDLMFEVARDRPLGDELSPQDVNSFLSLYQIPNGTVFLRMAQAGSESAAPEGPASGDPSLSVAPHVDTRFGYELHPPRGWMRIRTSHGVIVVNGVSWDYDATFQVIVRRYPTIESYLERYLGFYVGGGVLLEDRGFEHAGRRARQLVVEGRAEGLTEWLAAIETGDGRLVLVVADCPSAEFDRYRPWFEAALASLDIWPLLRLPEPG